MLKKCKKTEDVLFINAAEHFVKGKRQNQLTEEHITKIIDTYKHRKEEERYSKRISMERIKEEKYNLNISPYISTAIAEQVEALMTTCRALETEIEHSRTHAAHLIQAVLKEASAPAS